MNTPVLLITFNRPNHTRKVLERIVSANPTELFVFRDHWREERANERTKCEQVLDVIQDLTSSTNIRIHYLLPDINLGCGVGPMTAISWFFKNVEQGIVMEDDCLAHPDFFPYCEVLLDKYKNSKVKFINSTLYDDCWRNECKDSYGFSHYMCAGAWASWRDVWQGFDLNLKTINAFTFYCQVLRITHNIAEAEWWYYQVKAIKSDNNKKSYWDYQMQIHLFRQKALSIFPSVNLIRNIGFDAEGTHTIFNDGRGDRPFYPIFPIRHPKNIEPDLQRDSRCWAKKQSKGWLIDSIYEIYHLFAWRNKKTVR